MNRKHNCLLISLLVCLGTLLSGWTSQAHPQAEPEPPEGLSLFIPEETFPVGTVRIPYAIVNQTGGSASIVMVPVVERLQEDGTWEKIQMSGEWCGTPDGFSQEVSLRWFQADWCDEPLTAGHYRLSFHLPDETFWPDTASQMEPARISAEFDLLEADPATAYGDYSILVDWARFTSDYHSMGYRVCSNTGNPIAVTLQPTLQRLSGEVWTDLVPSTPPAQITVEAHPEPDSYTILSLTDYQGQLSPGWYRIASGNAASNAFYME